MIARLALPAIDAKTRKHWARVGRILFLVIAGIAAASIVIRERDAILDGLSRTDPMLVAAALVAAIVSIAMTGTSWRMLIGDAPPRIDWPIAARIFFLGQMGKYLPGSIWSFLASAELARQAGMARKVAVSSLFIAIAISLGVGALLGLLILPGTFGVLEIDASYMIAGGLIPMLVIIPPVRRFLLRLAGIEFPIGGAAILASVLWAGLAWALAGVQLTLLCAALGIATGPEFLLQAIAIYAVAWVGGFLFFIAPAGVGVRESLLVTLLATQVPVADAIVVAILSRVTVTIADLVLGSLALFIPTDQAPQSSRALPHRG